MKNLKHLSCIPALKASNTTTFTWVNAIVILAGGTISVESEVGKGSIFKIIRSQFVVEHRYFIRLSSIAATHSSLLQRLQACWLLKCSTSAQCVHA